MFETKMKLPLLIFTIIMPPFLIIWAIANFFIGLKTDNLFFAIAAILYFFIAYKFILGIFGNNYKIVLRNNKIFFNSFILKREININDIRKMYLIVVNDRYGDIRYIKLLINNQLPLYFCVENLSKNDRNLIIKKLRNLTGKEYIHKKALISFT
jgi:hypothetical protein